AGVRRARAREVPDRRRSRGRIPSARSRSRRHTHEPRGSRSLIGREGVILAARSHPAPVDVMVFAVSAVVILGGAIGVIASRNPVHSALSLVVTLFGIAVLFIEQAADFLAAVQ